MIHITDTEWEIMEVLWEEPNLFAKEIKDRLFDQKKSISTVKTLINRLLKKKAIDYTTEGKSYQYYPLIEKEEAVKAESENFIKKVFSGSKKELIMNLVKDTNLSKSEIDALRQLLETKRKG